MDELESEAKKDLLSRKRKTNFKPNQFIGTSRGVLSIHVTSRMIPRALKFMNLIIKISKTKGYLIRFKEYYGSVVVIDGIEFPFRLREKFRRIIKEDKPWSTAELEPIGQLVFTVDSLPRKEWEDTEYKLLDLKIPNIINYLEQKANEEIKYKIEREKRDKERGNQRQKRVELKRLQEIEEQKFKELLEACERWHQANRVKDFLSAIELNFESSQQNISQVKVWLDWAKAKVDEIYSSDGYKP